MSLGKGGLRLGAVALISFASGAGCGSSGGGTPAPGAAGQPANAGGAGVGVAGSTTGAGGTASSSGGSVAMAGSGTAGAGALSHSATAACSAYATAYCSLVLTCQVRSFNDVFGTMDDCTSGRIATCMDRFSAPGAQTTPELVRECAAALIPANGCLTARSACTYQGTLSDSTACAYDAQCRSKLCDVPYYGAPCGTCSEPAAKGGHCVQSSGCVTGLQCAKGVCVSSLPRGSACDETQFECAFPNTCMQGTCQPEPNIGQPCNALYNECSESADAECLKGVCQMIVRSSVGGDCDPDTGVLCLAGSQCNSVGKCELGPPTAPTSAADCK